MPPGFAGKDHPLMQRGLCCARWSGLGSGKKGLIQTCVRRAFDSQWFSGPRGYLAAHKLCSASHRKRLRLAKALTLLD